MGPAFRDRRADEDRCRHLCIYYMRCGEGELMHTYTHMFIYRRGGVGMALAFNENDVFRGQGDIVVDGLAPWSPLRDSGM